MIIIWKYLLFLGVIYVNSYSSSIIYQIIKGGLLEPWEFNFTIFPEDFRGIILVCIDSTNNQLVMKTTKGGGHSSIKYIDLRFNNISRLTPLRQLCGCDPCEDRRMSFLIKSFREVVNVSCNDQGSQLWSLETKNDKEKSSLSFPGSLVNVTDRMFIMIGNSGPYVDHNNTKVLPVKDQMVGCLSTFYYNNEIITFDKNGTKVHPSCPSKCFNNTCNDGRCVEEDNNKVSCDCSFTTFNGPYCRSMKMYTAGSSNSYRKMKDAAYIYIKMTWSQSIMKKYCLLEIPGRPETITLWTNQSHLMINDYVTAVINVSAVNFINVNVTKYYLIIRINYGEYKSNFSFDEESNINVGMSQSNKVCETFEGLYDLHFSSSQLQQIKESQRSTTKTLNETAKPFKESHIFMLIILNSSVLLMFVIVISLVLIIIINGRRKTRRRSRTIDFVSDSTPDHVELRVHDVTTFSTSTSYNYSVIDPNKTYIVSPGELEDVDNYILPKRNLEKEDPPNLPPRNDNL